jgi:hypothetical protein
MFCPSSNAVILQLASPLAVTGHGHLSAFLPPRATRLVAAIVAMLRGSEKEPPSSNLQPSFLPPARNSLGPTVCPILKPTLGYS